MGDIRIEDLILMLLAQRKPRDHSRNLEAFRTLFESDMAALNLNLNLTIGLFGVAIAAGIGVMIRGPEAAAFWIAVVAIVGFLGVIIWRWVSNFNKRRKKSTQYLYLIRLYYYMDKVVA